MRLKKFREREQDRTLCLKARAVVFGNGGLKREDHAGALVAVNRNSDEKREAGQVHFLGVDGHTPCMLEIKPKHHQVRKNVGKVSKKT